MKIVEIHKEEILYLALLVH